jgi:hypothetical protein
MGRLIVIVVAIAAVLGFGAPRAMAAFPGQNGVIATSDMASEIDFRNTDGSGIRGYCGATLADQRSAKNRRLVVEVTASNALGSVSVRSTPTAPVRKH